MRRDDMAEVRDIPAVQYLVSDAVDLGLENTAIANAVRHAPLPNLFDCVQLRPVTQDNLVQKNMVRPRRKRSNKFWKGDVFILQQARTKQDIRRWQRIHIGMKFDFKRQGDFALMTACGVDDRWQVEDAPPD